MRLKQRVLATTDPPLRLVPGRIRPLGARLLLNFDLPPTRAVAQARVAALGQDRSSSDARGSVISFVVAGAIAEFRAYEQSQGQTVEPVPIQVAEILEDRPRDDGGGWRTR
ncbi:hypothetical protein QBZ16_004439 [Prototheca wickerhamii]|uniref:Uncharacterized protein n=1 Tax=Prototheca wickerhamii TaxID=3111 RepID=A0AAD9MGV9_PROWI|nr:hypothetical protein QBZ16_004439 [Prototheca wickerhamii]